MRLWRIRMTLEMHNNTSSTSNFYINKIDINITSCSMFFFYLHKTKRIPGSPLAPYGLWGLECVLPGLGTLLKGEFGLGLRCWWFPCPPFVKPPAEYDTLWGIAGSGNCWNGSNECPGANSLWRGTNTGGNTVKKSSS